MTAPPPAMNAAQGRRGSPLGRDQGDQQDGRKILELGGIVSSPSSDRVFGIGAIITGLDGRSTVQDDLKQEQIVGTPTCRRLPSRRAPRRRDSRRAIELPTVAVAGQAIDTGAARAASPPTSGSIRSRRPAARPTRSCRASRRPTGRDSTTSLRPSRTRRASRSRTRSATSLITATALETALNTSYMAEQLSLFGIVVGRRAAVAGIGLGILPRCSSSAELGGARRPSAVSPPPQRSRRRRSPTIPNPRTMRARNGRSPPRAAVSLCVGRSRSRASNAPTSRQARAGRTHSVAIERARWDQGCILARRAIDEYLVACTREGDVRRAGTEYLVIGMRSDS